MLFKLSFRNMKKSIRDYTIYFLTLVLGVAIFYMFNSLDSQQAMLRVSASQREIIRLMIDMLSYISVFVAVILGLLIVYANNFLINRRKKEFGMYMALGMGKRQISQIILLETLFVGVISLVIGLVVGVFASQFKSILVAKLFEADMREFRFVFSGDACIKTCLYFAVMYAAVMLFSTFAVSRYKLINLLHAAQKNEKVKIKNPVLCIVVFLLAVTMLGYAYWKVTGDAHSLTTADKLLPPIVMGIVSTVLIFWSLSGFIIQIVQKMQHTYLKGTNMFVLRQMHTKINTMVISMSVICLMLFMTISILSSSLGLRNTMQRELIEMTPVDLNLYKAANLPEGDIEDGKEVNPTRNQREDSQIPIVETLKNNGLDMQVLRDVVEIPVYAAKDLTWRDSFGTYYEEVHKKYPQLIYHAPEEIVKISDYNRLAKLYGLEPFSLNEDEYIVICNLDTMRNIRDEAIRAGNTTIALNGKAYHLKYTACQDGYLVMSTNHTNTGVLLVPDTCPLTKDMQIRYVLAANYTADTDAEKEKIEAIFSVGSWGEKSDFIKNLEKNELSLDGFTKISLREASNGLATIVTFVAIYLGIIFLIASSAILALKQLTDSADNQQRYTILRKIGCDEHMINKALFQQIGIFFGVPLLLAMIHAVFGIQFVVEMMAGLASKDDLLPSVIATALIIGVIYGAYFLATYFGSKNIIKEET